MRKNVTNVTGSAVVADLVRQRQPELSPAERKLARVLLATYPIAGLESVARFAERAGVSAPSVTRFIGKLGFRGYPDFQEALRLEVQARLSSPLARYHAEQPAPGTGSLVSSSLSVARNNLAATHDLLSHHDVDEVVAVLSDIKRRVLVLGGRVSGSVARYLAGQLHLLRPGVSLVESEKTAAAQQLIDMRKADVLVVFDYRRYQADTIESARLASAQGVDVVLFTDPWLSPVSAFARQVLVTSVETEGPFDSLSPRAWASPSAWPACKIVGARLRKIDRPGEVSMVLIEEQLVPRRLELGIVGEGELQAKIVLQRIAALRLEMHHDEGLCELGFLHAGRDSQGDGVIAVGLVTGRRR